MDTQQALSNQSPQGALSFALLCCALSLYLLLSLDDQTRWISGKALTSQPRFWPALTISVMAFFSVINLFLVFVRRCRFDNGSEWISWARSVEFALWFCAYAALVPWIGYLLATLLISLTLAWRSGYRSTKWTVIALAAGLTIVVFFRGILGIHVPAASLYQSLPGPLGNFMATWF